ncbi:MAG: hypothetical protein GY845_02920 [Planctomycetes bacterium]|nr:hypothetical protein [Planctomycetota bacterium]
MQANLFRFIVSRPPQRLSDTELADESVETHPPSQPETPLLSDLLDRHAAGDRAGMRSRSRLFLNQGSQAIGSLDDLVTPIKALDQWLSKEQPDLTAELFVQFVQDQVQMSIAAFVKSPKYLRDRPRVGDTLLAHMIAGRQRRRVPAFLARTMRIFGILEQFVRDEKRMLAPGNIEKALKATILLPAALYPLPRPEDREATVRERAFRERQKAFKVLEEQAKEVANKISRHETAIDEIMAGYEFDRRRDLARANENTPLEPVDDSADDRAQPIVIAPRPTPRKTTSVLSAVAAEQLSNQTTELLSAMRIDVSRIHVVETVDRLENRLSTLARDLYETGGSGDPPFVMIGGILTMADDYHDAGSRFERPTRKTAGCPMPDDCVRTGPESPQAEDKDLPQGPGDPASIRVTHGYLMVVEQTLQRYELGEVAHIENVLLGERKDRTHRRKENTEESTLIETENIEDTERDLQATDRFELQTESSKVISEDTSLGVGLTVSGKYGPSVEFSANTSFSRDTSREESDSTATSFSRDVTERAVSRVQERVLERRTRREMLEVEETNSHQLNNILGDDHIAGIYRWVDKIYRAQVINYGLRAQIEIMIPEPAAFLRHAIAGHKSAGIDLEKPKEPGYCKPGTSSFVPLSARDICTCNYMFWVARYGVTGVKPPPPTMKIVGKAFDNKNLHKSFDTVSDGGIRVPDGYRAQRAWIVDGRVVSSTLSDDDYALDAYVGRRFLTDTPQHHNKALNEEDGDLPVSLIAVNMLAYVANIEVECRLGKEKYQAWQLATYEAIMIAYNDKIAEYENRLAALEIQQGVVISGNNPLRNEQLIRDELKRSALSIITGQHFDNFSALRKGVGEEGYPQLDLSRVAHEGPYIRFFEQAFEWEHIAYLFYPYFWGRKDDWIKNILLDDNDPMFADFLRAGAARLVVPVRHGFAEAVAGFLANGWLIVDGEDLALPGGGDQGLPLLSMLAEMKARQGYDGTKGEGTVDVTNDSADVSGTGTNFTVVSDTRREIHILGTKYLITSVTSETAVTLDRPYEGNNQTDVQYSLGVQFIGEPWQVRVPTSLVFLENGTSSLPVFTG